MVDEDGSPKRANSCSRQQGSGWSFGASAMSPLAQSPPVRERTSGTFTAKTPTTALEVEQSVLSSCVLMCSGSEGGGCMYAVCKVAVDAFCSAVGKEYVSALSHLTTPSLGDWRTQYPWAAARNQGPVVQAKRNATGI